MFKLFFKNVSWILFLLVAISANAKAAMQDLTKEEQSQLIYRLMLRQENRIFADADIPKLFNLFEEEIKKGMINSPDGYVVIKWDEVTLAKDYKALETYSFSFSFLQLNQDSYTFLILFLSNKGFQTFYYKLSDKQLIKKCYEAINSKFKARMENDLQIQEEKYKRFSYEKSDYFKRSEIFKDSEKYKLYEEVLNGLRTLLFSSEKISSPKSEPIFSPKYTSPQPFIDRASSTSPLQRPITPIMLQPFNQ